MKKLFALILALGMALPGMGAAAGADPGHPQVVALSTQMSGFLFTDMWGSNSVDVGLRGLLHGYGTIAGGHSGQYGINGTVVQDFTIMDDTRGDRTYLFTLARDLTYNDGTPITARDYVFNLLLQSDPVIRELGGQNTAFSAVKGYQDYATGKTGVFSGVRLLGEYEFSITVPASELPYYYELTYAQVEPCPIGVIAPGFTVHDTGFGAYLGPENTSNGEAPAFSPLTRELLSDTLTNQDGYLHQPRVTCGPYQLVEYDPASYTATLEINPRYKGDAEGRKPDLQSVKIVQMDNGEAIAAFEKGQVQMIHNISDADALGKTAQMFDQGQANVDSHLSSGYAYLAFACEQSPTDDVNVRKAIAMCLNRNAFCASLYLNNALPVYGHYGYGQWMAQQRPGELTKYDLGYDVESARVLLEQAGYVYNEKGEPFVEGKGQTRCKLAGGLIQPLELRWAKTQSKAADLLQEQLTTAFERLGIRLVIHEMSFADLLTQYYRNEGAREDNLFFLSEMFPYDFDPYKSHHVADEWQGAYNASGLRDEKLMEAAWAMRRVESGDADGYLEKWFAFQDQWNQAMPNIPIYCTAEFDVSASTITGFVENGKDGLSRAVLYATDNGGK